MPARGSDGSAAAAATGIKPAVGSAAGTGAATAFGIGFRYAVGNAVGVGAAADTASIALVIGTGDADGVGHLDARSAWVPKIADLVKTYTLTGQKGVPHLNAQASHTSQFVAQKQVPQLTGQKAKIALTGQRSAVVHRNAQL